MKKPKLKVLLFVDSEGDFYYSVPSPHFSSLDMIKWRLNKLRGIIYRYPIPSRQGLINIIETCKKLDQPAVLCITGHLYLKSCSGFPHFNEKKPSHSWFNDKIGRDWYSWDKAGDFKSKPGYYFGDIIEKEKNSKLFTFGLHAFAHEALTLESKDTVDSIISSGLKAADQLGINIRCFACPFEMTSDENDPERIFDLLRKRNIKTIFHAGKDNNLEIKRHFSIEKPILNKKLKKIWISNYFEGTSKKYLINSILKEIDENKHRKAVYCLGTHDFTHKNPKNLARIITFLKNNGFENFKI